MDDALSLPGVADVIAAAVAEDLGHGDITTRLTVAASSRASAQIVAKQSGLLAGLPLVERVYALFGGVTLDRHYADGDPLEEGAVVAVVSGNTRALLGGERVALNLLQHLSGIATLTAAFVQAVGDARCRIVDTRKTLPGLRLLEKYAVRVGGGANHRFNLADGILIKDNHIAAAGGVSAAVQSARAGAPHTLKIEVECTTLAQVDEALAAAADCILLDNMEVAAIAEAVQRIAGRALVEASGNMTLARVRAVAAAGVDLISVGALTHSAPAFDFSMKLVTSSPSARGQG
ncbi:MAG: carboxylating nicotinate-nucleotide diphosphorylase [Deltaproteobacteria bacterium]|nr:carboxylating nicotinate-nucleotide diphosphorylase [Deltaproteobacteria bacterium]